ncbi:MAG: PDZ domain-containing protein [Chitinophagaceae bacterium]|nr:PDZ domain-containing protein [Chitinophagaceae bacterium]
MKKLLFILAFSAFFFACKKDTEAPKATPPPTTAINPNIAPNKWIHEVMSYYYLWSDSMPVLAKTDTSAKPTDYFYKILYNYGKTDRFSWIDESVTNLQNQLNGISTVLGIKNNAFYTDNTNTSIAFVLAYVLKGSPAEKAGLKRGDIILKVDNQTITNSNYTTILANQTLKLELGDFTNGAFVSNGRSVTVTKVELQTNPILADTIIAWSGKKVGYLAYSQFLTSFDDSLRALFGRFKTAGVNELVLDFRYNGGGYVVSSDLITNLTVKNAAAKVGNTMNKKVYNKTYSAYLAKTYSDSSAFLTKFKSEPNNLGTLSRVFVLTAGNTASASELVINNLLPFMDVILIGENTYGKNVGSFTITDPNKRWDYGLQPITFLTANAMGKSDYGTVDGFTPTYKLADNVLPYKALGNPAETYLSKALSIIGNVAYQPSSTERSPKYTRTLASKESFSDNKWLDRKEMWMDPK